jgi:hypothetical protein
MISSCCAIVLRGPQRRHSPSCIERIPLHTVAARVSLRLRVGVASDFPNLRSLPAKLTVAEETFTSWIYRTFTRVN